jgi:hypothetical protein
MPNMFKVNHTTKGFAALGFALFWRLVGRVAGIVKSKDRHALCQAKAATENWNLEICRIM